MTVRPPREEDFDGVLALMRATDSATWGDSDWTVGELREHWDELDLERDAFVVELDGRLAGYVDVDFRGGGRVVADGYVHPELLGRGAGSALVGAAERRASDELARTSGRVYVHFATVGDDATPFFEQRGYRAIRHQWRMVIDLDGEYEVEPPPGVEIRPYVPGEERAIHEALEQAWEVGGWEHRPRSFDEYAQGTFERPGHDRSLCFVALERDEIVGASLNDWKRFGDWGWIGTLGVRPRWRRRGIGEALLRASFGEFARRGETRVALGVDAQSPTGATRLYERAGMRVLYEVAIFEKDLRSG
jgi:ribosomal protein S18 acetylase RimI-like enzyme